MSFSQVQRVFIVEHYLASHSYLTCQNKFRDTFTDSPVPNKSTISRLVNHFRDTGALHRVASNMRKRVNACITERGGHFQHLI
jgi:Fe2+ or Zn2+ uptake regulation protein